MILYIYIYIDRVIGIRVKAPTNICVCVCEQIRYILVHIIRPLLYFYTCEYVIY